MVFIGAGHLYSHRIRSVILDEC